MSVTRLKRYSKPRGAGDQTSGGRGKLLRATSDLSRIELVVRETLQNSWDARKDEQFPAYGVRIYQLDDPTRQTLGDYVFTDLPGSMHDLAASLIAPGVHAVEIFDRGTSGLDGPFRASEVAPDGEPNNFNSFVFDIGTTNSSETAGGTYGFGKTATFEVSRAHSVVYWSRCRTDEGGLEHRFIATSLHEPYVENGARFTGAHWWGSPTDAEIVPVRGEPAQQLGEALFRTHFGNDETGTSIMIIDPVISLSSSADMVRERTPVRSETHAEELAKQVSDALAYSAWPKTIPADGENPPMEILLYKNGIEQGVAQLIRDRYRRYAEALTKVRIAQGQQDESATTERTANVIKEETFAIRLRPGRSMTVAREKIFGDRSDNVVGHMHVAVTVREPNRGTDQAQQNALCLMRSEAELVVRYDDTLGAEDDLVAWLAVFKPTPECDRHFSAAEPPTHDGWNPTSAEDEISTYVVDKTLQQIRSKARAFLEEHRAPPIAGRRSVRTVSTGLRGFVPFGAELVDGPDPMERRSRRSRGGRRLTRENLEVIDATPLTGGLGQIVVLRAASREGSRVHAEADVYAITADGRLPLEPSEVTAVWTVSGKRHSGSGIDLANGEIAVLELRTRVATALDVEVTAESTS